MALLTASFGDQRLLHGDQTGPLAYPQTWQRLQGHPRWHGSASCLLALHQHCRKAVKLYLHGARKKVECLQGYIKTPGPRTAPAEGNLSLFTDKTRASSQDEVCTGLSSSLYMVLFWQCTMC